MDRRNLLQALVASGVVSTQAMASSATGSSYNASPRDGLMLWAKLNADLSGKTVFSFTSGTVWGFKPQADDLELAAFAKRAYGYQNLTVRKARMASDTSIVMKQRAFTFYLDPDTYQPVTELRNVFTGRIDKAIYPNMPTSEFVYTSDGPKALVGKYPLPSGQGERPYDLRVRVLGNHAFVDDVSFQRFQSAGTTWHKLEGNLWSYVCKASDLTDPTLMHIPNTWSQNLVAEWQTWTGMHGIPGHILFKGQGTHINPGQVPQEFKRILEQQFPGAFDEIQQWDD